jgi:hydrogenase small subunit
MFDASLFRTGISRRAFLKYCAILASSLALPPSMSSSLAQGLEQRPRLPVIWYGFQACTGCTESLLRGTEPGIESLILDYLSLDFHDTLQAAAGQRAEAACQQSMARNRGRYLLVVEGAIPLGARGEYSTCAGLTNLQLLREAAEGAAAILAVGSCAAFGGLPAAAPNPTHARSVQQLMDMGRIPRRPLANLPGCPPVPMVLSATLAHCAALGGFPELDDHLRPRVFYGATIHDRCPRLPFYRQGLFAERFDDEGARKGWCLFKLGCKGPATHNACAEVRWNQGTSFPVESGHPCIACSEPDFWDSAGFYRPLRGRIPIAAAGASTPST